VRARFAPDRLGAALLAGSALGAFAWAHRAPAVWALLLVCAASVVWSLPSAPPRLAATARAVVLLLVGGVVVLGWTLMSYPVLSPPAQAVVERVLGSGLAVLASLAVLSPAWPRAWTLYPSIAGLLLIACFQPEARVGPAVAAASVALFLHLLLDRGPSRRPVSGARLLSWGLFGGLAFLIARGIVGWLPLAQGKVEQMGLSYMSSGVSGGGFAPHTRLGSLESLMLSHAVALRVWAPEPRKLRAQVYTFFDGQGWHAAPAPAAPLATLEAEAAPELLPWAGAIPGRLFQRPGFDSGPARGLRSRIVPRLVPSGLMPAPAGVELVRAPLNVLRSDAFGLLHPDSDAELEVYGIVSASAGVEREAADEASLAACRRLPADTDPRLKELAAQLAASETTERGRIARTVAYVSSACHYSLSVGTFRSRQPVAEFLFEKKRGYCEYFASAAAVLLRLQGVPARYVAGFNVEEGSRVGDHYVVREADAHAWIEAYVPEAGWLEADPTPPAEYAAVHANMREDRLERLFEWVKVRWAELRLALRFAGRRTWLEGGLVFAAVVGLGVFARRWARRRPRRPPPSEPAEEVHVAPEVLELLSRAEALWARAGCPRPPTRAPREHLESIPAERLGAEGRAASHAAVDCFYRARFGGRDVAPDELAALRERLLRS
jgi:transglutaminase-like putative cysteine protease